MGVQGKVEAGLVVCLKKRNLRYWKLTRNLESKPLIHLSTNTQVASGVSSVGLGTARTSVSPTQAALPEIHSAA